MWTIKGMATSSRRDWYCGTSKSCIYFKNGPNRAVHGGSDKLSNTAQPMMTNTYVSLSVGSLRT